MFEDPQAVIAAIAVVSLSILILARFFRAYGSKRDFDSQIGAGVTMLQTSDAVIKRDQVAASMAEYSQLFSGKTGQASSSGLMASAGELTNSESVAKRQEASGPALLLYVCR